MATTFTPENSALLLIDHQVGTMQLIKNIDVERAKRMSLALAKTASILGIPTVLTSSQESSAKASSTPGPTPTSRRLSRRRGGRI